MYKIVTYFKGAIIVISYLNLNQKTHFLIFDILKTTNLQKSRIGLYLTAKKTLIIEKDSCFRRNDIFCGSLTRPELLALRTVLYAQ